MLLIIGYDGSADSRHAIDVAGRDFPAADAMVVHVWAASITAAPVVGMAPAATPIDGEAEREAERTVAEGVERARAAGLAAQPVLHRGDGLKDVAETLTKLADDRDADIIVVGHRGMSRLKELVLGSVSKAVLHSAHRPVLVIPAIED